MNDEQKRYWFNPKYPLWLPPGTIRALLVLILTSGFTFVFVRYAFVKEELPSSIEKIMTGVLIALIQLILEYIKLREAEIKPIETDKEEVK